MSEGLIERVRANGLLDRGRALVVMLSGGRDSTCLLDVAVRISGDVAVSALHVDYRLREDSEADRRHCVELCAALGVSLEVHQPSKPPSGNLQGWARGERYRRAGEIADVRGAEIAAGHTATDQVETILYRLASSPSRRALLGMSPREGRLLRPLLSFTREQTADYCRLRGLKWREDPSNSSDAYARNRVRNRVVPALREIHPAAEQNLLAVAELLRDEAAVLDEVIDQVLGGRTEIELERLRALPAALRRLVIQRLADHAVGSPAAGVARREPELAALPVRGSAALDLPKGVRALAQDGMLRFGRTPQLRRSDRALVRQADPGDRHE